jgi:hypothetical protein
MTEDAHYSSTLAGGGPPEQRKWGYSIVWGLLFFAVVWPLSWFVAPIWVFLLIGEAFFPPCT